MRSAPRGGVGFFGGRLKKSAAPINSCNFRASSAASLSESTVTGGKRKPATPPLRFTSIFMAPPWLEFALEIRQVKDLTYGVILPRTALQGGARRAVSSAGSLPGCG